MYEMTEIFSDSSTENNLYVFKFLFLVDNPKIISREGGMDFHPVATRGPQWQNNVPSAL